jgi:hypothetical protein
LFLLLGLFPVIARSFFYIVDHRYTSKNKFFFVMMWKIFTYKCAVLILFKKFHFVHARFRVRVNFFVFKFISSFGTIVYKKI